MDEKLTRTEVVESLADSFCLRPDSGVIPPKAYRFADWLIESGLPVAPEPVEPDDPVNCRITDARGSTWRKYSNNTDYWTRIHDGTESALAYIEQPIELFRKVDTPEPAPKYTASRNPKGAIVDVTNNVVLAYSDDSREWIEHQRDKYVDRAARYQAALDLLDREERKTAEYDKSVKADGWEVS